LGPGESGNPGSPVYGPTAAGWRAGWLQFAKAKTLLPAEAVAGGGAPEKITLIPYGCAKFRMSMFPITARAGKASGSEIP
jgi:hypothetical protein